MFRLYNLILLLLPFSSHALECACRGYAECENFLDAAPAGKCSGSYCFVARRTPEEPPIRQGCIDTHQDVSTVSKCVRNRRGAVFCVCNTDNCNGADHEMTDITDLPTIFCHVINDDMDASVGRTCVSHSCYQTQALRVVEFNDLRQTSMEYGCTTPLYYDSSLRIMRGPLDFADDYQYFIQSTQIIVESGRICSTNLCNKPAHIYVQMGDVLCYVHNGRDAPDMRNMLYAFTAVGKIYQRMYLIYYKFRTISASRRKT
ncbi:unnamed protein product [Auanema sp. JU1783]|nr:unnamed protein product [Auanema sp. JU1783]